MVDALPCAGRKVSRHRVQTWTETGEYTPKIQEKGGGVESNALTHAVAYFFHKKTTPKRLTAPHSRFYFLFRHAHGGTGPQALTVPAHTSNTSIPDRLPRPEHI